MTDLAPVAGTARVCQDTMNSNLGLCAAAMGLWVHIVSSGGVEETPHGKVIQDHHSLATDASAMESFHSQQNINVTQMGH